MQMVFKALYCGYSPNNERRKRNTLKINAFFFSEFFQYYYKINFVFNLPILKQISVVNKFAKKIGAKTILPKN